MRAEKVFTELPENNCWRIFDDEDDVLTDFALPASVQTSAGAVRAYKAWIKDEAASAAAE